MQVIACTDAGRRSLHNPFESELQQKTRVKEMKERYFIIKTITTTLQTMDPFHT